jgi:hypothetical protein
VILTIAILLAPAVSAQSAPRRCLVVDKAGQELVAFKDGLKVAAYPVSFGVDPLSDKRKVHDLATPEGLYFISYKKDPSQYHRTLGLSYPNLADAEKGLAGGVISKAQYAKIVDAARRSRPGPCGTGLGCAIAIHGGGVFRRFGTNMERGLRGAGQQGYGQTLLFFQAGGCGGHFQQRLESFRPGASLQPCDHLQ